MMRKAIILAAFFCAACSNYSANLPSIKPYKMDIQQGNVVTSKMMLQLRPGMTKSQVRFIMGTPLIVDPFHADRWDYIYRMSKGGKLIEQRHVILDFENDQLKGVRGDVIPVGTGEPVPSEGAKPAAKKPAAKQKEKGLLDKLKFWKSDEPEAPAKLESQPELTEPKPAAPAKTAPAPVPAPKAEPAPQQAPVPQEQPEAAPQAEPAPEAAPAPAEQPSASEPAKQPEPEPVKQPEPAPQPEPKPAAKAPVSAKPVQPEAAKVEPAKAEPKVETQPAGDLPPEDAPDFFERMLEKIGF